MKPMRINGVLVTFDHMAEDYNRSNFQIIHDLHHASYTGTIALNIW